MECDGRLLRNNERLPTVYRAGSGGAGRGLSKADQVAERVEHLAQTQPLRQGERRRSQCKDRLQSGGGTALHRQRGPVGDLVGSTSPCTSVLSRICRESVLGHGDGRYHGFRKVGLTRGGAKLCLHRDHSQPLDTRRRHP